MTAFAFLAMLMTAVCVVALAYPLLRKAASSGDNGKLSTNQQSEQSLRVHRERLARLDQAVADGELSVDQAQEEKDDLARALLEDAPELLDVDHESGPAQASNTATVKQPKPAGHRSWSMAALVGIVLPLASAVLYSQNSFEFWHAQGRASVDATSAGSSALPGMTQEQRERGADQTSATEPAQVVAELETRLQQDPENGLGWRMLARAYFNLGRAADAVNAYQRAYEILGDQADLLVEYAEAESVRDGYRFSSAVAERLERALVLQPNHSKALMLGGISALQAGDKTTAERRIARALAAFPPDSEQAKAIESLAQRAGLKLTGTQDTPATPANAVATEQTLKIEVSLAAEFQGEVSGTERVFVFARAAAGPPMPLAVRVLPASALPTVVSLSDADSMVGDLKLSSANSVVVGARLSKSGSATPSPGDLESLSAPLDRRSAATVRLVIDSKRQ